MWVYEDVETQSRPFHNDVPLRPPWSFEDVRVLWDASQGKFYYHDLNVNMTVWERPRLLPADWQRLFYATLGVTSEASSQDIRTAFRRKSLACHPDKGGDEETFKRVNEVHRVLSSEELRTVYDWGGEAAVQLWEFEAAPRRWRAQFNASGEVDVEDEVSSDEAEEVAPAAVDVEDEVFRRSGGSR